VGLGRVWDARQVKLMAVLPKGDGVDDSGGHFWGPGLSLTWLAGMDPGTQASVGTCRWMVKVGYLESVFQAG